MELENCARIFFVSASNSSNGSPATQRVECTETHQDMRTADPTMHKRCSGFNRFSPCDSVERRNPVVCGAQHACRGTFACVRSGRWKRSETVQLGQFLTNDRHENHCCNWQEGKSCFAFTVFGFVYLHVLGLLLYCLHYTHARVDC